jgi:predicted metal-dependent hydrolase
MPPAATVPVVEIEGRSVPVTVRRSVQARRMSLRVDAMADAVILVMPDGVALSHGLRFVQSRGAWIAGRLAALPPRVPFADGAVVPVLGVEHVVRHRPDARRGVWTEDGALQVSGGVEFIARRVCDWLKSEAQRQIAARAYPMAEGLGRKLAGIVVRDQRSRWGSCTSDGRLAFSWRLVLAPESVLTYVVAHEVAHLEEMNHSPAFWRVVHRLMPDSAAARHWLRAHGPRLHRYG